jgi:hypothetical protein
MPNITVSWGELFDRVVCLELDLEAMEDEAALFASEVELDLLRDVAQAEAPGAVHALAGDLKDVVRMLRDLDHRIESYEKDGSFGPRYVELVRQIREQERRRLDLRRGIDDVMRAEADQDEGREV